MAIAIAWREQAACWQMDLSIFFPDTPKQERQAKAICHGCPVRLECLHDALRPASFSEYGVRGGFSAGDRRRMIQRRRRIAAKLASAGSSASTA